MSADLIAFLKDRLDEDERITRAATGTTVGARITMNRVEVWSADRAFAEVAAKRRIIDDIVPKVDEDGRRVAMEWGGEEETADELLRLLAVPYADHADYRDEWRMPT